MKSLITILMTAKAGVFYKILLVFFLFQIHVKEAQSQKTGGVNMNEIKKVKKENVKAAKRAADYGKKRHMSIQSKETRKRMKTNLKNAEKRHKKQNR